MEKIQLVPWEVRSPVCLLLCRPPRLLPTPVPLLELSPLLPPTLHPLRRVVPPLVEATSPGVLLLVTEGTVNVMVRITSKHPTTKRGPEQLPLIFVCVGRSLPPSNIRKPFGYVFPLLYESLLAKFL